MSATDFAPAPFCPICGKPGDCLTPEQVKKIQDGIAQADRGELHYLGSFAKYATEEEAEE